MGQIVHAATSTHVPTMQMSEQWGALNGARQLAIDGHFEIARCVKKLRADTIVTCDTHWGIDPGCPITDISGFEEHFTAKEFPQVFQEMPSDWVTGNGTLTNSSDCNGKVDLHVLGIGPHGDHAAFLKTLPEYAEYFCGEAAWNDTDKVYGALGWDQYDAESDVGAEFSSNSGRGQSNAILPVQ